MVVIDNGHFLFFETKHHLKIKNSQLTALIVKMRLFASAVHFGLSAAVVALIMGVIVGLWYPPPLFYTQDLLKIVLTIVGVDLVLGPLLTFIVYNPKKKHLKYDLLVIVLIQLSALGYGVHTTFASRPVYVVYSEGRFDSVSPNEYVEIELEKVDASNAYLKFPITGPRWIGAVTPSGATRAEKMDIDFSAAVGGGLRIMPQYYVPYEKVISAAISSGKRASDLDLTEKGVIQQRPPAEKKGIPPVSQEQIQKVKTWLTDLNLPLEKIVLLPLKGRDRYAIVALNADTGAILDTLSQDPWWYQ